MLIRWEIKVDNFCHRIGLLGGAATFRCSGTQLGRAGVAADSRYRTVISEPPLLLYTPLLQSYDSIARLMVAVAGDPQQFHGTLRRALQDAAPDLPVRAIGLMREQVDSSLWERRSAASLLSLFGVLALLLACAGLYGVVAYAVSQQTREIGIRMAHGAAPHEVARKVLARALQPKSGS